MKVIVQIPCFNEAETLPMLFEAMPRSIPSVDTLEFLLIDDGSVDETEAVAKRLGIQQYIRVPGKNRRWLGRAFRIGVDQALLLDADILVNTDGDNQYPSSKIPELIAPILSGAADVVIGDRHPADIQEFSKFKRLLQRFGNQVIALLTGEASRDAVSGFRAYSREALLQLNVITNYTYTVDTLIQSYKKGLDVAWIDIAPNPKTRDSRLIKSSIEKVRRSGFNILRLLSIYEPFRVFLGAALLFFLPAFVLLTRFFYFYLFDRPNAVGHVQSVVLGSACLVISVLLAVFSVIAGLLSVNRILLEDLLRRVKRLEYERD